MARAAASCPMKMMLFLIITLQQHPESFFQHTLVELVFVFVSVVHTHDGLLEDRATMLQPSRVSGFFCWCIGKVSELARNILDM